MRAWGHSRGSGRLEMLSRQGKRKHHAQRFLAPTALEARAFKGIAGTLKQKTWFPGLRETIWTPFGALWIFLAQIVVARAMAVLEGREKMVGWTCRLYRLH